MIELLTLPFKQPKIQPLKDPSFLFGVPTYVLVEDYEAEWMGRRWVIPAGYEFDGASVPRGLWTATGYTPYGLHIAAALVHDWFCDNQPEWSSSVDALDAFRHYMKLAGVRPRKIRAMCWAVGKFGPQWERKEKV